MKFIVTKKYLLLISLLVFFSGSSLFALEFELRVFDPVSSQNVPDVPVIVIETGSKFFTNASGIAKITVPDKGFYTFRAIVPDKGIVQSRLQVQYDGQKLTFHTSKSEMQDAGAGGLHVIGKKDKTKLSRYQVRLDEVKRIPGTFGEALRGIESLPGVNAPPFGTGDLTIRGARENANYYMIDELPIAFPFHLIPLDAVIHNDLISTIDIYTGAYPANYGDATGGIIAIETIDDVKKFGGHATFSLWSTKAMFNGKIGKGGYWIGAGKASYLHKTLKPYIPDGILPPVYWDGQFKSKFKLTKNQDLYMYAFGAKGYFAVTVKKDPTWDPTVEIDPLFIGANLSYNKAFHTEAIRHIWKPASRVKNTLTLINTETIEGVAGSLGVMKANRKATTGYTGVREELSVEIMKNHIFLDAGIENRVFRFISKGETSILIDPNNPAPNPYDSVNPAFENIRINESQTVDYSSGWLIATFRAGGFEFKPSARADHYGITGQSVVDPRGTMSYKFPTNTTLIAGAGVYHRLPLATNEYSNSCNFCDPVSPSSGNPNLRMERAEHYGLGVEQTYKIWTFKVEAFRHYYTETVVEDPYITTPYKLNYPYIYRITDPLKYIETEILNPANRNNDLVLYNQPLYYSNDGTGFSEGYELYVKKENPPDKNGWYGWISYTWSKAIFNSHQHIITEEERNTVYTADERRVIHQIDNSKDGYANYDRTHILNIVYGYKLNRNWQFGSRWKYMTSRPYTQITGDDGGKFSNNGRKVYLPEYSDGINYQRLRPYHRLDIRIDRFFNYSWGYGNFFFEALNVYVRKNPAGFQWSSSRPYSATNPEEFYDFSYLNVPAGKKVLRVPLFNVGLEVKF